MKDPFVLFWIGLILISIAWYAILILLVGFRAGREILELLSTLEAARGQQGPEPGNGPASAVSGDDLRPRH